MIALSFLLILSIVIVQGFFNPANETLLYELGPIKFYKEGLIIAFRLTMRVINMVSAFGVLVLTTSPTELRLNGRKEKGRSPKIGYVILSVLQIIPQPSGHLRQNSGCTTSVSGMETEGSLVCSGKGILPIVGTGHPERPERY